MHGRTAALAASILTLVATAAPAQADQTLGAGGTSAVDGVVTSWRVVSPTAQTARLRSTQTVQRSSSPATVTTATSDSVSLLASATPQTFAARLPVAAGGQLTLLDASGTSGLQATVEPDADGDGYGDTTQDGCPKDFTDHEAPCGGTQTAGSPLTLAPDPDSFSGSGSPMEAAQQQRTGSPALPLAAGILTRWRVRVAPSTGDTYLQVLRPDASGTAYTVVAESPRIHVTDTTVVSLPAQVAIKAGDRLAARSVVTAGAPNADLGAVAYAAGDDLEYHQPPSTTGDPAFAFSGPYANRRLLVQADVEPDADADGKGDVTQDSADLQVKAQDVDGKHPYFVGNAGPDAALDVAVTFVGAWKDPQAPVGWTCTVTERRVDSGGGVQTTTCTTPRLDAKAFVNIDPGAWNGHSGPNANWIASSAAASSSTPDPDTSNNKADFYAAIPPYIPPTAPVVFNAPPCGHVVKGTRDDDVLKGTAFGDRLVGLDGADLLKGGGGDDCLEGGPGNDVMDGGDGNDRLAGSSGKDRLSGGNGDDKLTGGRGNDRISGGNGNDTLSPGAGKDSIAGGPGNDTINSVDGVRETVDCGPGKDTVRADRRDRLLHCEKVTRRR